MQEFDAHNTWFKEEQDGAFDELYLHSDEHEEGWHTRVDLLRPSPLQLTLSWRAHVLRISTLATPTTLTIGSTPDSDIVLEHDAFGLHESWQLPLLSARDHEWILHIHPSMPTTFHRDALHVSLQEFFLNRLLTQGGLTLSLAQLIEEQGHFQICAGDLEILIERVPHAPRAPLHAPLDPAALPYLGLSTALHVCLMLIILTLPAGLDQLQEEREHQESARFVRALVISPIMPPLQEPPPLDAADQLDLQGDGADAELGAQHRGEEGKSGGLIPSEQTRRLSVKRRDDSSPQRVAAQKPPDLTPLLPSHTGALAVLAGKQDLFGAARMTQGDAVRDHTGNVRHAHEGEASGSFGIGLVGVGKGGGAHHGSVGIAMDKAMTRIKMGGQGVAQRKEKRGQKLDDLYVKYLKDEDTAQTGCLTEEIIKVAIRRRRNQVRTCYEHHLLKDRTLAGRLAVELTIGNDGHVSQVEVIEDALNEPAIGECVTEKLRDLSFPSFSQCQSVVVRYPFNFHPKQLMVLP